MMPRKPKKVDKEDPTVIAVQNAIRDRDPFCTGTCTVPDYQRLLYYSHGDALRRIDFSKATAEQLDDLYRACEPADFGRNGEDVLDQSYRKAGKMEPSSLSTSFDPRSLGIDDQVSKALLTENSGTMEMELYKLNVHGPGDFFKAHKDTPRSTEMFGSLVVLLPSKHGGGQLVLRQDDTKWTIDFTDQFAAAAEPTICFVAFFGDIEHEVLPVTSGYRVTLTYNLYHKPSHGTSALRIPTPFHQNLKDAIIRLVNDRSKLPNGGYLGFGLVHQYVYPGREPASSLLDQLKGADRALADVCDELGLSYSLKLLYRRVADEEITLITSQELSSDSQPGLSDEAEPMEHLQMVLENETIDRVEGVEIVGCPDRLDPESRLLQHHDSSFLKAFYRKPVTQLLEITPMKSSVGVKTPYLAYGNQAELDFFYGSACMLVAVAPADARGPIA